ncbi:putative amino-acid ABC transporter permease protein y4tG [Burkholderia sp. 8Y]|uniref:ectoine/hydroxyectoine ABC transporter permease subunit EhuD n=1 Tax=Burkholderia sp. 8Y TaxID=2653133 RepID=UPI0012F40801|nr:ectoine/hydroxyectoine ABC transporter permease subunit EhuD [Burkholderia sp. 8Y]VXC79843.1 putative amino-acid ABC transporter permease protein y4tG [Burkholderia sp. 8Y]
MTIFDWSFAWHILPVLGHASLITVEATLISFCLAAVLGLILAILRIAPSPLISVPTAVVVEIIRSTPLLIQVLFIYFGLPRLGLVLDPLPAGIVAIGIHYATYCSEVYRAGLLSIPRGQWEACIALNLSGYDTFRKVLIPQAIPPVVPALGNYLIALFKDTPLLSAIAVVELMQTAKIIGSQDFRYVEPITLVGLFFLIFSLIAAFAVRHVEAWLRTRQGNA